MAHNSRYYFFRLKSLSKNFSYKVTMTSTQYHVPPIQESMSIDSFIITLIKWCSYRTPFDFSCDNCDKGQCIFRTPHVMPALTLSLHAVPLTTKRFKPQRNQQNFLRSDHKKGKLFISASPSTSQWVRPFVSNKSLPPLLFPIPIGLKLRKCP